MRKTTKILSSAVIIGIFATNVMAMENESYIGIKTGSMDFDKTVIANVSGYENTGPYLSYKDTSLLGVEYQSFYTSKESPFLFGYGFDILFNEGDFLEGGMLDLDLKLGAKFDAMKVYGIVGYGLQSLSDYTVATGTYYGVGASYDITNRIALSGTYTKHSMTTAVSDYNNDISDNQKYESKGFLFGLAYKF